MAFNLPQFLRRTPRDSLRSYFAFRSITLAVDVDWSAAQRAFLDVLRAVVENLPDGERERVFQDFESADILADEPGQLAVRSLFSENAPFVLAVEGMANGEARSLAALMENEALFRKALVARLRPATSSRPTGWCRAHAARFLRRRFATIPQLER